MKRVTVQLPDALHKRLKLKAVTDDISLNALYVQALELYLQKTDKSRTNDYL